MSEFIRFELDGGGEVLVEVEDDAFGVERAARDDNEVIRASGKLETALATIKPAAQAVLQTLADLSPDEKEVEFGIKLTGEAGAVIAKTTGECNFTVRLAWKSKNRADG